MKLAHLGLLLLSVLLGGFLGQLKIIQAPLMQTLMPEMEFYEITLTGTLDDYFSDEPYLTKLINSWYAGLSPQAKAGQLIMPAWTETENLQVLIDSEIVGGFMWLGTTPEPINSPNSVPLLISSDAEPSLLKYRFEDSPFVGETSDLKTTQDIRTVGRDISNFLKAKNINLNFAPVYDQNTNQSVISTRSFGPDPTNQANQLANVFKSQNIIPSAKHFPGHGLVSEDTHLESATITGELSELPQFVSAIGNKVPVMMVGHLAVNTPEIDTQGRPATVSKAIMQNLLRDELNFQGVVITDAMNMTAVSDIVDRDLQSLLSGSDIVLMPEDPEKLNAQLVEILEETPDLLEAKIKRVLKLKLVWLLSKPQQV